MQDQGILHYVTNKVNGAISQVELWLLGATYLLIELWSGTCHDASRLCDAYYGAINVGSLVHSSLIRDAVYLMECRREQVVYRVQSTLAHVTLIALSTLPVMLLQYFFRDGLVKCGTIGLNRCLQSCMLIDKSGSAV